LLGCVSFDGDPIGYAHFLGLVFFDCHPGSHRRRALLLRASLSSPSDTTHSLSSEGYSYSNNNTRSLSSEGHSLDLSSEVYVGLPHSPPPAARTLRIALSLLRKPALQQAGRSHARWRRGQRTSTAASSKVDASVSPPPQARHRPSRCRRGCDATSNPPPRLCSPRRKSSSRWKLIVPFY
jgi:hypothetical protein